LEITDKHLTNFLYVIEGVGVVFVAFYLVAYLSGLPTTAVLHSELVFRLPLFALGAILLVLVLCTVILAAIRKNA